MNRPQTYVAIATAIAFCLFTESNTKAYDPTKDPPNVDLDSFTASIQIREGLRILEKYETFRISHDIEGIFVDTEVEPPDALRLDALNWQSGPGMQSWAFKLPKEQK